MKTPTEFVTASADSGKIKGDNPVWKILILAVLSGFLIGMGAAVTNAASCTVENASIDKIISGLLFPIGLVMVVLTGAELFTGDCLMTISVWEKRLKRSRLIRNLILVYVGNFIGGTVLAYCLVHAGQLNMAENALAVYSIKIAQAKCVIPFGKAVLLGIFCNILVCIAVMMSSLGENLIEKTVGAYLPIIFFVISGFEHCVANMYYIPVGLFAKSNPAYAAAATAAGIDLTALTWSNFFLRNLVPVTIGNIIGGVLVAALFWSVYRKPKEES